jgi:hypothetical protein
VFFHCQWQLPVSDEGFIAVVKQQQHYFVSQRGFLLATYGEQNATVAPVFSNLRCNTKEWTGIGIELVSPKPSSIFT